MDVIPQIRLMAFLLEAVTRNSHKIWLTVLLTLTMLYVFSTIAYLVFHNEVRLRQNTQRMKMHPIPLVLLTLQHDHTTTVRVRGEVRLQLPSHLLQAPRTYFCVWLHL